MYKYPVLSPSMSHILREIVEDLRKADGPKLTQIEGDSDVFGGHMSDTYGAENFQKDLESAGYEVSYDDFTFRVRSRSVPTTRQNPHSILAASDTFTSFRSSMSERSLSTPVTICFTTEGHPLVTL